jgi:hypothetical protein
MTGAPSAFGPRHGESTQRDYKTPTKIKGGTDGRQGDADLTFGKKLRAQVHS